MNQSFLNRLSVFQSARIKLTLWYMLIIMIISGAFSLGLYRLMTEELDRLQKMQKVKIDYLYEQQQEIDQNGNETIEFRRRPQPVIRFIDPEIIEDSKKRVQFILLLINLGILTASTAAAYILAGKTLRPIQNMLEEQNRFITDASHELKTPLTALRSEIEVAIRSRKITLTEARQLIKSNLEEVISLQTLTDNLMKLTQFGKSNHLYKQKLSILEIIEEAKRKIQSLADKKEIKIEITGRDYPIKANRLTMVELFIIFLDNAIKYSEPKTEVRIRIGKTDHTLKIEISDQGIGIPKDETDKLFERFYRASKSRTKDETAGFGLGLSIAKQIVDTYKGEIKVKSEINQGTTFTVFLPQGL